MAGEVRRMRYFDGLFLKQEEFTLEQKYHTRMRRLHNRHLHSPGIAYGLEVQLDPNATNVTTFLVKAGMALDNVSVDGEATSREIVLVEDESIDVAGLYTGGQEVWVWISYAEEPAVQNEEEQLINFEEKPEISTGLVPPTNDSEHIRLAKIVMDPGGAISANSIKDTHNDQPIRKLSGAKLSSVETDRLILKDAAITASPPYLDAGVFTDVTSEGILVNADWTRFSGTAEVKEDLFVQLNATVSQDLTILQDTSVGATLAVTGDATFQSNVLVDDNLTVKGTVLSTNASGALEIDDDVHVDGTLALQSGVSVNEFSSDTLLAGNSDAAVPTEKAVKTYVDATIAQYVNDLLVGSVTAFALNTPPTGWLECNGTAVSRTTYAALFARIGTTFGTGDGTTTFTLPDLRGEFVRGWDHGRGVDVARTFGSAQDDALQDHAHKVLASGLDNIPIKNPGGALFQPGSLQRGYVDTTVGDDFFVGTVRSTGATPAPRLAAETRARNVSLMYCIKY